VRSFIHVQAQLAVQPQAAATAVCATEHSGWPRFSHFVRTSPHHKHNFASQQLLQPLGPSCTQVTKWTLYGGVCPSHHNPMRPVKDSQFPNIRNSPRPAKALRLQEMILELHTAPKLEETVGCPWMSMTRTTIKMDQTMTRKTGM
jgi:hypothetical protein